MKQFTKKLENVLVPFSEVMNNSKSLKGISGGFSSLLPIIMVGAIFTLLSSLNIGPYQKFLIDTGLKSILDIPKIYTTDMISLYAVFLIAKAEADVLGMESRDSISSGLISLMFFLILIPLGVTGKDPQSDVVVKVLSALGTLPLGSAGLFTAMIIGILIPRIHNLFVKNSIGIKMPDSVPPMISKSFSAIIPAVSIALLAIIIRQLFLLTPFESATMAIYGLLRAPLQALTASPLTMILLLVICNLLWFFGIHGGMVTMAIIQTLYTGITLENLDAFGAGLPLPNIITSQAWFTIGNIGGSGCAIGLCLCIALFAKSQRYKALNKVSFVSGLCSISEPLVFGVPLVLNPVMLIPMLITPVVTFLLGYFAMVTGIVPFMNGVSISMGTPQLISAFICWSDWRGVILQLFLIVISTIIYYPFFRTVDNMALYAETKCED